MGKLFVAATSLEKQSSEFPSAGGGNRALRVLQVTPLFYPYTGGIETHVFQVSRRLVALGADVTILTTDPTGSLPAEDQIDGVPVHRVRSWPARRDYYFAPGLDRFIRGGTWDMVHVQSYHTLVPPLTMISALRSNLPYVLTFHGGGSSAWIRNKLRRWQRGLQRPLLARARRLVALAEFEIEQYAAELRLSATRFVLIPNGADLPQAPVSPPGAPTGGPIIASVGRLERYKGHHRVIEALPFVLAEQPNARLWIAGKGPFEAELRRLAQQYGVSEHVQIRAIPAEDRARMAQELSQAGLVVLLSDYETQPIAALEAAALGRSVLVADNSGMRELAQRGWARSISLTSTPRQIADAILAQLNQPLTPRQVRLPSWDGCAAALFDLYQAVVKDATHSRAG